MPENIAQTVQKVIQDLVAPEVKELKVLVSALQKQIDQGFEAQGEKADIQYKALDQKADIHFQALMAAFREFQAKSELESVRIISQLSASVSQF